MKTSIFAGIACFAVALILSEAMISIGNIGNLSSLEAILAGYDSASTIWLLLAITIFCFFAAFDRKGRAFQIITSIILIMGMTLAIYPMVKYGANVHRLTGPAYIVDTDHRQVVEVYDTQKAAFRKNNGSFVILKDQPFSQQCEKKLIEKGNVYLQLEITYRGLNQNDSSLAAYLDTLPTRDTQETTPVICRSILGLIQSKVPLYYLDDNTHITDAAKEIIQESSIRTIISIPDTIAEIKVVN